MKASEFVKNHGLNKAKALLSTQGKTIANLKSEYAADQLKEYQRYIVSDDMMSFVELKRLVESHELVETLGGFERVKKAIDGKHIGYTHFYLHSNGRYVFLDHYVDFIPDHAQHIGMFNKAIADVESCMEVSSESN